VLLLRQLEWEKPAQPGSRARKKRANTAAGCFFAVELSAVLHQVCVVPDYKFTDPQRGTERFLLNHWVHAVKHVKG
jgi:hypothetical protein